MGISRTAGGDWAYLGTFLRLPVFYMVGGRTPGRSMQILRRATIALFLGGLAACGGGGENGGGSTGVGTPVLTTVNVTLSPATLAIGQVAAATATGLDQNGAAIAVGTVTWSSSTPTVATVSSTGTVTGVAAGTASIVATVGAKQGQAAIVVTQATSGNAISLTAAGQSQAFLTSASFNSALNVQAGSQYLIAVVNTDPSVNTLEGFNLTGTFSATSSNIAAAKAAPIARSVPSANGPTFTIDSKTRAAMATFRRLQQNHLAMLNENRQIYARFGNPRAVKAAMQAQSAGRVAPATAAAAVVQQTIGVVNKVYVKNGLSGEPARRWIPLVHAPWPWVST